MDLKFGLYGDAGTMTCAGHPGSQGYETQDAQLLSSWGVDFVRKIYSLFLAPLNYNDAESRSPSGNTTTATRPVMGQRPRRAGLQEILRRGTRHLATR